MAKLTCEALLDHNVVPALHEDIRRHADGMAPEMGHDCEASGDGRGRHDARELLSEFGDNCLSRSTFLGSLSVGGVSRSARYR